MATTDSPLNIKGSIKDLSFYKREGSDKTYVRQKGGAHRNHIRKSWRFKTLRQHQSELKGRAQVAKDAKQALGLWSRPVRNPYLQVKISGVLKQVQDIDGLLNLGTRPITVSRSKEVFNQVKFHYNKPLSEILMCPYTVESSEDRRTVKVTLHGLFPKWHVIAPVLASHFQLCLNIGVVRDYVYTENSKKYISPFPLVGKRGSTFKSEWIPVNGNLQDDIVLTATLPDNIILDDSYTVLRCFGIVYGKMLGEVVPVKRERGSIVFLGAV